MEELERRLDNLERVTSPSFIVELERRLNFVSGEIKLSDLSDVSGTDSATTGQVLKKTATTWQPGTDNTA